MHIINTNYHRKKGVKNIKINKKNCVKVASSTQL